MLAALFGTLGSILVLLVETGPRSEALRRLSRIFDEELAAGGRTRNVEVRRIIGVRAYL